MRKQLLAAALAGLALFGATASHASVEFWAVNTSNELVRYNSANVASPAFSAAITGLRGSDGVSSDAFGSIVDLAGGNNGQLYGIDGHANLYSINTTTGAATFISGSFNPAGFNAGLAYDPFLSGGGLRWVSDAGENVALSYGGVATPGAATFYGSGDANHGTATQFSGLAIDPDFGIGYAIDANLDVLALTNDGNFSEFFTVGSLGIDVSAFVSIDFLDEDTLIAALSTDAFTSQLYEIEIATGTATLVGDFGTGISGIVNSSAIPEPSAAAALFGAAALGFAAYRRRRAA